MRIDTSFEDNIRDLHKSVTTVARFHIPLPPDTVDRLRALSYQLFGATVFSDMISAFFLKDASDERVDGAVEFLDAVQQTCEQYGVIGWLIRMLVAANPGMQINEAQNGENESEEDRRYRDSVGVMAAHVLLSSDEEPDIQLVNAVSMLLGQRHPQAVIALMPYANVEIDEESAKQLGDISQRSRELRWAENNAPKRVTVNAHVDNGANGAWDILEEEEEKEEGQSSPDAAHSGEPEQRQTEEPSGSPDLRDDLAPVERQYYFDAQKVRRVAEYIWADDHGEQSASEKFADEFENTPWNDFDFWYSRLVSVVGCRLIGAMIMEGIRTHDEELFTSGIDSLSMCVDAVSERGLLQLPLTLAQAMKEDPDADSDTDDGRYEMMLRGRDVAADMAAVLITRIPDYAQSARYADALLKGDWECYASMVERAEPGRSESTE